MTAANTRRLPAEWEPQDGILIAWPHAATDWQDCLAEVEPVFVEIVREISRFERVMILVPDKKMLGEKLFADLAERDRVDIFEVSTNDTWVRDFGPITVMDGRRPLLLDFGFNGWGLKFPACHDNMASRRLQVLGAFGTTPMETSGLILEGGSFESDGCGTLLVTAECLLSPNRNPHLTKEEIERILGGYFGVDRFIWLQNGFLEGDDTDSHIDTLARLCPEDTICYVSCDDTGDPHYQALAAMARELAAFRTRKDRPYRLLPLPWPSSQYDEEGNRLPATYANFLVLNGAVLVPTYGDRNDDEALRVIKDAFPDHRIIGINCLPLIREHGALHCLTMQIPKGVLP
jgi:agmatine deiminase